jgi:hypothetical protein
MHGSRFRPCYWRESLFSDFHEKQAATSDLTHYVDGNHLPRQD